jgi:flagellar hook-associated protein 3 FlgL
MRVDPYYVTNLVSALDQTQGNQQQLSQELSTGLSVNSLSQNPTTAGENVRLLNQIQSDDSFTQSSSLVQGQLQVADSALGSVVSELTSAISLATSGNNGTLNKSDLQSISNQIAGIRSEVLSLANTSYQGNYIFGGANVSSAPFTLSNATTPATVTYNGDSNVNTLTTPTGQTIALNLPGNQIFLGGQNATGSASTNSVFDALNNLVADFANGNPANVATTDTESLNTALNYLSQQRVTLDNSLTQLTDASNAVTSQQTQLTAAQTNLMQADLPTVSSQLALAQTQQTALINVIAQLGTGSLFDKLQ